MQTAAQPFNILAKKIDVAFVCNEDGLELHSFGMNHIEEARAMVEKMTKRHQQKYTVQIKNVLADSAQAHIGGL